MLRTVGQARDDYLTVRRPELRPDSVKAIRANLLSMSRHVGDSLVLREVTSDDLTEWMLSLQVARSTLQSRVSAVRVWFAWMCERGWLSEDPARWLPRVRKPRSVPRALRCDQIAAIWQACPDERARTCVSLMLHEGLRRGEVARLEWGDVYPADQVMVVRGKGGRERVVPLSAPTWDLLDGAGRRSGPVVHWLRDPDIGVTPETVTDIVRDVMRAAGVDSSAHALRHTAATDALRSGCDLRTVQKFLGHSTVMTTEIYLPWEVDDLRRAVDGRSYDLDAH